MTYDEWPCSKEAQPFFASKCPNKYSLSYDVFLVVHCVHCFQTHNLLLINKMNDLLSSPVEGAKLGSFLRTHRHANIVFLYVYIL